jgi:hypothetical protein
VRRAIGACVLAALVMCACERERPAQVDMSAAAMRNEPERHAATRDEPTGRVESPVEVVMNESAQAGAQVVGMQSHSVPATAEGVLRYVAGRLVAPGGLGARLDGARAVFEGRVGPTRFASFEAPAALTSGNPELRAALSEGPSGPGSQLTLASATLSVTRWLAPADAAEAEVRVAWPMSGSTGAAGPRLPEGASGLVVLDAAAGPMADAVGELMPGAVLWAGPGQPLLDAADAADAVGWYLAQKAAGDPAPAEAATALSKAGAVKAGLALHRLLSAGPSAVEPLKAELAAGKLTPTRALAARAALWKLGAEDAATGGFDPGAMDSGSAGAFGMAVFVGEDGGPTTILAPPEGSPLAAGALGVAP